jgi:PIN domain nuclease of toxin-antitoxin system
MDGALLDTHALIWLYDPAPMSVDALLAVDHAAQTNSLYVSPMSAWELGAASRKKNPALRQKLRGLAPENWFVEAAAALAAISTPVSEAIGLAACALPLLYGYSDPGEGFVMATAHVHGFTFITRDQRTLDFARRCPDYLKVVSCRLHLGSSTHATAHTITT